jgi:hypothetical protein
MVFEVITWFLSLLIYDLKFKITRKTGTDAVVRCAPAIPRSALVKYFTVALRRVNVISTPRPACATPAQFTMNMG